MEKNSLPKKTNPKPEMVKYQLSDVWIVWKSDQMKKQGLTWSQIADYFREAFEIERNQSTFFRLHKKYVQNGWLWKTEPPEDQKWAPIVPERKPTVREQIVKKKVSKLIKQSEEIHRLRAKCKQMETLAKERKTKIDPKIGGILEQKKTVIRAKNQSKINLVDGVTATDYALFDSIMQQGIDAILTPDGKTAMSDKFVQVAKFIKDIQTVKVEAGRALIGARVSGVIDEYEKDEKDNKTVFEIKYREKTEDDKSFEQEINNILNERVNN